MQQGCFRPEWRLPFVQVMAKRRRSAVPAARVMGPTMLPQAKLPVTATLPLLEPGSLVLLVAVNRLRAMAPPQPGAAD